MQSPNELTLNCVFFLRPAGMGMCKACGCWVLSLSLPPPALEVTYRAPCCPGRLLRKQFVSSCEK
eukprot:4532367-Amphidinium_carterae.1